MIVGESFKDSYIISRSFRFICPNITNIDTILKQTDYDLETSYFSTAVGDNRYVNPLPGFNFNTDPSPAIIGDGIPNQFGNLGRYYKRMIDDNVTLLTLTAGVPEFTGILRFLINSFDYASSLVTNKGRAPSWAFYVTEAVTSIAFYPFQLIGTGLNFLSFLTDSPKNSWYYVKPAMGQYLAATQGIYNDLLISAGFTLTSLSDIKTSQGNEARGDAVYNTGTINGYGAKNNEEAKKANITYMNKLFPDAINDDGTVDVVKIIGRGARKYRYFLNQIQKLDKKYVNNVISFEQKQSEIENILNSLMKDPEFLKGSKDGIDEKGTGYFLNRELSTVGKYRNEEEIANPEIASSYYDPTTATQVVPQGEEYQQSSAFSVSELRNKANETTAGVSAAGDFGATTTNLSATSPSQIDVNQSVSKDGWLSEISELVKDAFLGGMDAVTFRVEGGASPITDNFSNQTQQSEIASFFNGTVSAVNNFRFNVQGGATGIGLIDGVLNKIKEGGLAIASGSVIGNPILALLGNARLHIPEHWSDSTANLHTESYEIYCEANYGHPYSIATNIFLPLALIAPFVFPISTGGSTYTTPFMCKAFCRGRSIIKTGIIKNASITFGEGELGWTKDRLPLNMRIRLEIADLDGNVTVPVVRLKNALEVFNISRTSGNYLGDIGGYNSWLARVGGQDYLDTVLKFNRLNKRITRFETDFQELFSASRIAGAVNDSIIGSLGTIFTGKSLNR